MRIVFLEDDVAFATELISSLQAAGFEVDHKISGRDCLKAFNQNQYDIALIDWEVPEMSGVEVLESLKLKGSYPPVIFITGRDAEEDVIAVIEAGADDYIVKPVNPKILIARINALYRRSNRNASGNELVDYGALIVDFGKRKFTFNDNVVRLTEKELDLALYLFSQVGVLLSRAHLTKVVWGTTPDIDTRTLDVHISHLRSKLNLLPQHGWRLISVYHQGYRLERLD
jgi:two-component system, OmpR family, response regulator RegX3